MFLVTYFTVMTQLEAVFEHNVSKDSRDECKSWKS